MSAPVPAALPAARDPVERRVGHEPEHHRVQRVDLAAERAGERDLVDRLDAEWSISRRAPAYSAALASWIARTSFWVIADARRADSWRTYENVRPSATTRGERAAQRAVDRRRRT